MPKFAFSANAFRRYTLLETIGILAGLGYEGIEIMADVPHAFPPHLSDGDFAAIRHGLSRHHLYVSNINAFMLHAIGDTWRPSWIERDATLRARRVEHTSNCIDLADKVGAKTISTEPGGPLDGMSPEEATQLFLEGLRAVENKARDKGVRVLIEPEPGLLIESSSQFRQLFEELDPEVFGLNFDVGHFYCVGEDPVGLVWELKQLTHHFHLEDISPSRQHYHLMLGEGAIDIHGVLKAILDTGYDGFVTVELYPYEDKPVDAAGRALRYLESWKHRERSGRESRVASGRTAGRARSFEKQDKGLSTTRPLP